MIGNQGLTERRYTRRRVHGGRTGTTGTTRTGVGSSVKRQAAGVESGGWEQPARGVGGAWVPLYHVATYPLCIPRALSRLTGGPWYVMGASECRPMSKHAAAARRQPQATMQRLSQAHGGRVDGLDRVRRVQSAERRVQSAERVQSPLQSHCSRRGETRSVRRAHSLLSLVPKSPRRTKQSNSPC
jgi:hypothetical protein